MSLVVAPGMLVVAALLWPSTAQPAPLEGALYSVGAGYALLAVGMLALSYLPGGILAWQVAATYGGLEAILLLAVWRSRQSAPAPAAPSGDFPGATADRRSLRWLLAGATLLFLLAGFLRLTSLGYSEFHGDEARSALRAAAVMQGVEDVLFLHRKAPGEILAPTTVFALTGSLDEASARLMFSLAGIAALAAVWLLGWRMIGPAAGWTAALLLAVDGYLVGFARFVQYQSVVLLVSVLGVLIAHRLYRHPAAVRRYLVLAALLVSGGLLFHYDAALALLPITCLLVAAVRNKRMQPRELAWGLLAAALAGGAVVALFYGPFVAHPNFTAHLSYLWLSRIHGGGNPPYNNLALFFLRTSIYSSTYYVLLLAGLSLAALSLAYWQGLQAPWRQAAITLAVGSLLATFWRHDWLKVGNTDYTFVPFVLALVLVVFLPRLSVSERTLWLWFSAPFLVALFMIGEPDTHVHIFFVPWLLVIGSAVQHIWDVLGRQVTARWRTVLAVSATAAVVAVFGVYSYLLFVYHEREVLLERGEAWPAFYWLPAQAATIDAFYGFPLRNGWKVVGALYDQGVLAGDYDSNQTFDWTSAWYTRGQNRCDDTASWYFAIDYLEPWTERASAVEDRIEASGFQRWSVVEDHGRSGLVIYGRADAPAAPAASLDLAAYATAFDASVTPHFPLDYPVIEPRPATRLDANLDNRILLEGYDLEYASPLKPGDTVRLTLYWRALAPIRESLKVFNQAYCGSGTMVAQQDSFPVCNRRPTVDWLPGELIVDRRTLEIAEDAPPGVYPLVTGMYSEDTMQRLPVLDAAGNPQGTEVRLGELTIVEE